MKVELCNSQPEQKISKKYSFDEVLSTEGVFKLATGNDFRVNARFITLLNGYNPKTTIWFNPDTKDLVAVSLDGWHSFLFEKTDEKLHLSIK